MGSCDGRVFHTLKSSVLTAHCHNSDRRSPAASDENSAHGRSDYQQFRWLQFPSRCPIQI
jgi:hypothetical protein